MNTTEQLEKDAMQPASELLVSQRIATHTMTCGVRRQMRRLQILVAIGVGASVVFGAFQMAYVQMVVERTVVKVLKDFGIRPAMMSSIELPIATTHQREETP